MLVPKKCAALTHSMSRNREQPPPTSTSTQDEQAKSLATLVRASRLFRARHVSLLAAAGRLAAVRLQLAQHAGLGDGEPAQVPHAHSRNQQLLAGGPAAEYVLHGTRRAQLAPQNPLG